MYACCKWTDFQNMRMTLPKAYDTKELNFFMEINCHTTTKCDTNKLT